MIAKLHVNGQPRLVSAFGFRTAQKQGEKTQITFWNGAPSILVDEDIDTVHRKLMRPELDDDRRTV